MFTQGSTVFYEGGSLSDLKPLLVVTGTNNDSSTFTIDSANYSLSGDLTAGTSTITVTYDGLTRIPSMCAVTAVTLASIEAVFTQGSTVFYEGGSLSDLKPLLVVTGTNNDSSTFTIDSANYSLSGDLTAGTSTITVTYGSLTDTFDVAVTAVTLASIEAVFTQGSTVFYEGGSLSDLKPLLVVTGTNNDSSTFTIDSANYSLSGDLTAGTSTITVTYGSLTDTFDVAVTAITLASIEAVFTQGSTVFYEGGSLSDLKPLLVVTGTNNDSSTFTIDSANYSLSGDLTAGTSTITVTMTA